jgi:hypothetical protein
MKLDKETLIKQKFWVALCAVAPLLLIVWLVLVFGVSGDVSAEKKKYDDANKAAEGVAKSEQKNESFVAALDAGRTLVTGMKDDVWKKAWEPQSQLMTWPKSLENLARDYYGDSIADETRRVYEKELYWDQYNGPFKDMIAPAEYQGGWESVLRFVGKTKEPGKFAVSPTTEECWLAQEDLWVQRELLRVVSDTIENLAEFQAVPNVKDVTPPAGTLNKQFRYRNSNWEVDLFLKYNNEKQLVLSEDSTIKNVNSNKRTLLLGRGNAGGLFLRVKQGEVEAPVVEVQGNALAYEASTKFPQAWRMDNIDPNRPFQVQQVFDWYSSPIKRVDTVALGQHGHRLSNYPLVSRQIGPKVEDDKKDDSGGGPGGFGTGFGSGPAAMNMGSGKGGAGGGLGGSGNAAALDLTPNELERKRYIHVTPQVRRMPVALVLIVDQAHVPDVLTSFANSKLRIQTVQEHWHHVQGIHPKMDDSPGTGTPPGLPGTVGGPSTGSGLRGNSGSDLRGSGSGRGAIMGAASGRGGKGGPGATIGSGRGSMTTGGGPRSGGIGGSDLSFEGGDEDVPNLVELAIYGIASLYERFPPKPPAPEGGAVGGPTK